MEPLGRGPDRVEVRHRLAHPVGADLARVAAATPVVDGGGIRSGLERWGVILADRAEPGIFTGVRELDRIYGANILAGLFDAIERRLVRMLRAQTDLVLEYNRSLTPEEKAIVEFMRDGPRSTGQSGHWLRFAQDVSRRDGNDLDAVRALFDAHAGEIAAVIEESLVALGDGDPLLIPCLSTRVPLGVN